MLLSSANDVKNFSGLGGFSFGPLVVPISRKLIWQEKIVVDNVLEMYAGYAGISQQHRK